MYITICSNHKMTKIIKVIKLIEYNAAKHTEFLLKVSINYVRTIKQCYTHLHSLA